MKHEADLAGLLTRYLDELGIPIPGGVTATLVRHLEWLLAENAKVNLTAITDPRAAVRLHTVDSLVPLEELRTAPEGAMLDIGTGGGFPGIPLAVATGRTAVLLDSVRKKCNAVAEFVAGEGLDGQITVIPARAEELSRERPEAFSAVTVRAVSELPSIVELAAPLLHDSGILVALKARIEVDELERGRAAGEMVGLEFVSSRTVELPGGGELRTVLVFRKTGPSSVHLPRRIGMAQKRPLA